MFRKNGNGKGLHSKKMLETGAAFAVQPLKLEIELEIESERNVENNHNLFFLSSCKTGACKTKSCLSNPWVLLWIPVRIPGKSEGKQPLKTKEIVMEIKITYCSV